MLTEVKPAGVANFMSPMLMPTPFFTPLLLTIRITPLAIVEPGDQK